MELPLPALLLSDDCGVRGGGQPSEALFGALYRELRGIARRELARLGSGGSLGATSLIHEACLDIAQRPGMLFPDRARRGAREPPRSCSPRNASQTSGEANMDFKLRQLQHQFLFLVIPAALAWPGPAAG